MIRSKYLEEVCREISDMPADVDSINSRLKGKDHERLYNAGKIHLRLCLEKLSEKYPLVLDPIKNEEKRDSLIYLVNDSVVVRSRCNGRKICEADNVVLVRDLPVLFDAKISRYRTGGMNGGIRSQQRREKKGNKGGGLGIVQSLIPDTVEKKLSPFRKYFGQDIGYAVLVPNDEIGPFYSSTSYMFLFVINRGVIVPLYTSREDFKTKILGCQMPQTE